MGYFEGDGESLEPTPWAVYCDQHGIVYLTEACYIQQMCRPDDIWRCPHFCASPDDIQAHRIGVCGAPAWFQDDIYEAAMGVLEQEVMEEEENT